MPTTAHISNGIQIKTRFWKGAKCNLVSKSELKLGRNTAIKPNPKNRATKLTAKDSVNICPKSSLLLAPCTFLMPISLMRESTLVIVRFIKLTIAILIMPKAIMLRMTISVWLDSSAAWYSLKDNRLRSVSF